MKNNHRSNYNSQIEIILSELNRCYSSAAKWIIEYTDLYYMYGITHKYSQNEKEYIEERLKQIVVEINKSDSISSTMAKDFLLDSWYDNFYNSDFIEIKERVFSLIKRKSDKKNYSNYDLKYYYFSFYLLSELKKIRKDFLFCQKDIEMICRKVGFFYKALKEKGEKCANNLFNDSMKVVSCILDFYINKNKSHAIIKYVDIALDQTEFEFVKQSKLFSKEKAVKLLLDHNLVKTYIMKLLRCYKNTWEDVYKLLSFIKNVHSITEK